MRFSSTPPGSLRIIRRRFGIKDLVRIDLEKNAIQLPSFDDQGCFTWVNLVQWEKNPKSAGLRVELEDGHWVECTPEHRFPVARDGNIAYVTAGELSVGDHLLQLGRFELPRVVESEGIDETIGEFVGWYLAEGNLLSEEKGVNLSLGAHEQAEAENLIRVIQKKFGITGRIHIYDHSLHLIFPGRFMIELVHRFVRGETAKTKRLAREAFIHGPGFLRGVLTGYLKGDGHWEEKTHRWRIGLARNKGLIQDISVICRILGFRLRFSEGFVPYRDARAEVIRGEIRENTDGALEYATLDLLGLPSRRFFSSGQSYSLENFRRSYKLVTRKSPDGVMTEVAQKVLHGDIRPVRITAIRPGNQKVFYDLSVNDHHVFALANGLLTHNSNPMPNFRGVRFTNAHETLLWAQKQRGAPYTFNYQAMKTLNDGIQMRSDWSLPICSGKERLRVNGEKAHPTQKPEALLYRVLLASTQTEDLVLDPFFGTGTTGAVCRRLRRHFIGIERNPFYVQIARERISSVVQVEFDPTVFVTPSPRRQPRIPFGLTLENGLLEPGQVLYFGPAGEAQARILMDGSLEYGGQRGSIHQIASQIRGGPCNGWEAWYYAEPDTGERRVIDELRQRLRAAAEGKDRKE